VFNKLWALGEDRGEPGQRWLRGRNKVQRFLVELVGSDEAVIVEKMLISHEQWVRRLRNGWMLHRPPEVYLIEDPEVVVSWRSSIKGVPQQARRRGPRSRAFDDRFVELSMMVGVDIVPDPSADPTAPPLVPPPAIGPPTRKAMEAEIVEQAPDDMEERVASLFQSGQDTKQLIAELRAFARKR
jgi:hypothetical protein